MRGLFMRKSFLIFTSLTVIYFLFHVSIYRFTNLIIRFEFLTRLHSTIILLLLLMAELIIYCIFFSKKKIPLTTTVLPIIGVFFLIFFGLLIRPSYRKVEQGSYTLYIEELRTSRHGSDRIYLVKNLFFAEYLTTTEQNDDCSSSYEIIDGTLIISKSCGDHIEIAEFNLNE